MSYANPVDKNGLTWDEWVKELFKFENCDECGRGEENHQPAMINGLFLARCIQTEE